MLAVEQSDAIDLHMFIDERSAAFAALGYGRATDTPALVVCTSGTAAAHFHAAVIEADLSSIPLVVCTADRPPELWDIAAPQAINQTHLYGPSVRFFAEPGVPDAAAKHTWRSLGARLAAEAYGRPNAGPVHLNCSFREPLLGQVQTLPEGRPHNEPWVTASTAQTIVASQQQIDQCVAALYHQKNSRPGVLIAGQGTSDPAAVVALSEKLGWPLLANHHSGCRSDQAILHFDALLRNEKFATTYKPDVILRFGEPLTSKALAQWASQADTQIVATNGRWSDPTHSASLFIPENGAATGIFSALALRSLKKSVWASKWHAADNQLRSKLAAIIEATPQLRETDVIRHCVATSKPGSALVVSSSMPIRELEWFGPARQDITVYANRGANGIDGIIATAIGTALSGKQTTLLIGDIAFLHDCSSLVGLAKRNLPLTIVVLDNSGGQIFSHLPQAAALDNAQFSRLFVTPHDCDIAALCDAHGIETFLVKAKKDWPTDTQRTSVVVAQLETTDKDMHQLLYESAANII